MKANWILKDHSSLLWLEVKVLKGSFPGVCVLGGLLQEIGFGGGWLDPKSCDLICRLISQ